MQSGIVPGDHPCMASTTALCQRAAMQGADAQRMQACMLHVCRMDGC